MSPSCQTFREFPAFTQQGMPLFLIRMSPCHPSSLLPLFFPRPLMGRSLGFSQPATRAVKKKKEGETVVKAINGSKKGLALAAVAQLVECCLDSPLGHLPGCGRSIPCRGTYGRQPIDLSPYPSVYKKKKKIRKVLFFFPLFLGRRNIRTLLILVDIYYSKYAECYVPLTLERTAFKCRCNFQTQVGWK